MDFLNPKKPLLLISEILRKYTDKNHRLSQKDIATLPETAPKNSELFRTIEVLDEAIAKERQVAFTYNSYDTDKKLHPRRNEDSAHPQYPHASVRLLRRKPLRSRVGVP